MEVPTNSGSLLIENNFQWDLCMFLQQNGVTVANLLKRTIFYFKPALKNFHPKFLNFVRK